MRKVPASVTGNASYNNMSHCKLNQSLSNLLTSLCECCFQDEDLDFTLATDFEIGHFFRERIIPRAVLYFTGEALEDDESVRICSK